MKRASLALMAVGLLMAAALAFGQTSPVERHFHSSAELVQIGETVTYPLDLAREGLVVPRVIGDTKIDRRLSDPRTVYYKLPQVWQHWVPAAKVEHRNVTLGTVHYTRTPPIWGIFKTSFLADFNANPDFPWETTFGLNIPHRTGKSPYETINFLSLPETDEGRLMPVAILGDERPIKWIYPPGTMLGEVIYVSHKGKKYVQEIRTRTKNDTNTTWFPGIYRPVKDRAEFQALTKLAYEPGRKYMAFRNPEEDEVFKIDGTVERLPDVPEPVVLSLLSRPFQDVTESDWHPAAEQDFHILPKDYSLGLLAKPDSVACASCHRQTQISVRNLIPREPKIQANPSKVGNIRGSDGIFTWHPFSMLSVKNDDAQVPGREIYVRRFDAQNGIVQILGHSQNPPKDYKLTLYVQKSLKPYELPTNPAYLHKEKGCNCGDKCPCGAKCDCGDKCDCEVTKADYQPFRDSRVVVQAPSNEQVVQVNVNQSPAKVQASSPSKYEWKYRTDQKLSEFPFRVWLYKLPENQFAGYWDASAQAFRPASADGQNYGPLQQPPIPVPSNLRFSR